MAFSDLCKISNAYKAVENEPDQSERIMVENAMVHDIITKILDETTPNDVHSNIQSPEKSVGIVNSYPATSQYNSSPGASSYIPPHATPDYNTYQDNSSKYKYYYGNQGQEQNGFNFGMQNGLSSSNGFASYPDSDVSSILSMDPVGDVSQELITPEHLNLLRLAAQEIRLSGSAQFAGPNNGKLDDKSFNPYEPSQRHSMPDQNMYSVGNTYNRPNSLNLDVLGYNTPNSILDSPYGNCSTQNNFQNYPNKYPDSFLKESHNSQSDPSVDLLTYLNQLNLSMEQRPIREEPMLQGNIHDYSKLHMELNGHGGNYPNGCSDDMMTNYNAKANEEQMRNKLFQNFNRNDYQQMSNVMPPKQYNGMDSNYYLSEMMKQMSNGKPNNVYGNQNYDSFPNTSAPSVQMQNSMNYKPMNGYQQNQNYMQTQPMGARDAYQNKFMGDNVMNEQRPGFDGMMGRDNPQTFKQNQELARQMNLFMRNRPPPNQLNVDVSFLHENNPFNLGFNALLGPSPPVPPSVLPSPMLDLPLLVPFYTMRAMRRTCPPSAVLHARLDACYEQWRQLERERKRTEARLALAYPGRAVSSSNSIPVPRLPSCPTRVDRLTVDMLREHTKVLTLMGKMETLRASVCVAQNTKPKPNGEDGKTITVLKRGQENSAVVESPPAENAGFDTASWKEDIKNFVEIAPHSEVEGAMLAWRGAVAAVQAARRRELTPHTDRHARIDPITQLADAVKQLAISSRRARCAMWCDLTLTVALAPPPTITSSTSNTKTSNVGTTSKAGTTKISSGAAKTTGTKNETANSKAPTVATTNTSTVSTPKTGGSQQQENPSQNTEGGKSLDNASGDQGAISKQNNGTVKDQEAKSTEASTSATESKAENKPTPKPQDQMDAKTTDHRNQQRRGTNYRHRVNNQQGRSTDFYQKNQRYDNRFNHNRHPYHYLATGPIN